MKELLEESPKYKLWKSNILKNGLEIKGVEEVYTRHRYNGEVLFSLLMLDAITPEGDKMPPICFLKGEVVSVLICLIDKETSEKYLLLVKQRRIVDGGFTYEHPAGMVDGSISPEDIAIQEVKEETNIDITKADIINLSPNKRFYPSTGTSDEAMYMYYAELKLSKAEIDSYNNKKMGSDYEFERITTHVFPFKEGHKLINNSNGLLLDYLYLSAVKDFQLLSQLEN